MDEIFYRLVRIKVPVVLATVGEFDRIVRAEDVEWEVNLKVDVCIHMIVSGCGHLILIEDDE